MEDSTAQDLDQPTAKSEEPLTHRVKSKVFKVRQEAFEELARLLKSADAGEIFPEYCDILPKSINDSNPAAQEKALLAFQALLSCQAANKNYFQSLEYTEVVKTLIDKCLGQGKPNVKTVAGDILQLLFEKSLTSQNQQTVIDGIVWSLGQKNQKTICAGVGAVVDLLNTFGPKKLNFLKPFFGEVEKLAGSSNSAIRTEALNFYKEAGKWLGDVVVKPFIAGLKKAQIDELEKFFQENAGKGQPIAKKNEDGNGSNTGTKLKSVIILRNIFVQIRHNKTTNKVLFLIHMILWIRWMLSRSSRNLSVRKCLLLGSGQKKRNIWKSCLRRRMW